MLLFLLVVIPGRGEAVGFNEIRDAVALWHRVFGTLPALEQFIQEGRPPRVQNVEKLGAALEAVSREEASNPFLPLARGALFTLTKSGPVKGQAAKASSLAGDRVAVRWLLYKAFLDLGQEAAADRELRRIREIRDRLGLDRITYLGWYLAQSAKTLAARQNFQEAEKALALAAEFDPALPEVFFAQARILLGRGSPRGLVPLVKGWWISLTSPTYGLSHWANILASFLFAIPLILLLVGLLLIVRVTHLFGHDLAERKRQRLSPTAQAFLPIPIYLLPVLLGLGLLPSLLLLLLLLGIYLKGRERLLWGGSGAFSPAASVRISSSCNDDYDHDLPSIRSVVAGRGGQSRTRDRSGAPSVDERGSSRSPSALLPRTSASLPGRASEGDQGILPSPNKWIAGSGGLDQPRQLGPPGGQLG